MLQANGERAGSLILTRMGRPCCRWRIWNSATLTREQSARRVDALDARDRRRTLGVAPEGEGHAPFTSLASSEGDLLRVPRKQTYLRRPQVKCPEECKSKQTS